jgi:hypothetical protein
MATVSLWILCSSSSVRRWDSCCRSSSTRRMRSMAAGPNGGSGGPVACTSYTYADNRGKQRENGPPGPRSRPPAGPLVSPSPLRGIELRIDEPPFVQVTSNCYTESACCKSMFQVFQMFQRYVAEVDQDVAHVIMAIHVCFKCMFQMFYLFQTYVTSVLSGYCKSRSRCCIYMHVASICFKCSRCFHMHDVHMFGMVFKCFSSVFHKCLRLFQVFHLSSDICYKYCI